MYCSLLEGYFVFFKQKTADEMRISDWSSDVCSSDLGSGVPVETYDITQPCGVSGICTKFLPCLSSGEAPDAAVFLQYRAGFYSRRAGRTFFYLTCVGRGAHSHIEVAIVVEGE